MSKNPSERKHMPGEDKEGVQRDTQQGQQHKDKDKGTQDWNKDKKNQQQMGQEPTKQVPTKQGPAHHTDDTQAGDEGIDDRKRRPA
jgi:hypothetical protein